MSIRKVSFAIGEYYHVYNRGNSKQTIFLDEEDYQRFVSLLYVCNSSDRFKMFLVKKGESVYSIDQEDPVVAIGAYCLMPNHFHILITPLIESGVSIFMQKVSTAYAMYFNQKHERTGGLFEGKFKAEHVDTDRYLKYLFSYIHLNPIKLLQKDWKEKGIKNKDEAEKYLNDYRYSSYAEYMGDKRLENKILSTKKFPDYFAKRDDFIRETHDWLFYNK
jgi:putative transposase